MVMDLAGQGEIIEWDENESVFEIKNRVVIGGQEMEGNVLGERQLRSISRDLIKGLFYIHSCSIVHRDIKPQNILFDANGVAMLADFGVSSFFSNSQFNDQQGTFYFMSPECFTSSHDGFKADIWALGVSLYSFAYLQLPFLSHSLQSFQQVITTQQLKFPSVNSQSVSFQNFISKFLIKDPLMRANLIELSKDEWVNKGEKISLEQELVEIQKQQQIELQITEEELSKVIIPLEQIIFMKQVAKQFKNLISKKSDFKNEENDTE